MRRKIGIALEVALVGCVILATRVNEVDLPVWRLIDRGTGPDPATLHLSGEFVESNLGLAEDSKGALVVRMIAEQYLFVPQCIVLPAGVPVHFRITSADTAHMLSFLGTGYALKAVPGTVTESTFTFTKPGQFKMPCHEFCGPGHYAMRSQLEVVSPDQFPPMLPAERRTCEPR